MARSPRPRPSTSARRTCPACSRRHNQHIADDCPVCLGDGFLVLGRPALLRYPADVVSKAVEYALESQARKDLTVPLPNLALARQHLTAMVHQLRKAGLLAVGDVAAPTPVHAQTGRLSGREQHTAAKRLVPGYVAGSAALLDAPPVEFDPDDRPLASGGLPGFSSAGFICHLSRVADPLDPLTTSTRQLVDTRRVGDRTGRVLAQTQPLF